MKQLGLAKKKNSKVKLGAKNQHAKVSTSKWDLPRQRLQAPILQSGTEASRQTYHMDLVHLRSAAGL